MSVILWLTDNYPPQRGGMAQSCDRIVDGLRRAGVQIEIIHFVNKEVKIRRQQQQNGGYTAIPYVNSEAHVLNITWNHIKTIGGIDSIVCFGGYLSMIGAPVFSQWLGVKLITLIRGNDLDAGIFTPRKRGILQDVLEASSQICAVSTDKVFKIQKWLKVDNVHFVPNSINLGEWRATDSELKFAVDWKASNSNGKTVLGLFGQLKAKKGLDFFLEALRRTSWVENTHLLLIGETEEHLSDLLEQVGWSYTILPFHDRYELMKYYLCCDAMVIPSYYDGMPNVLLEAGALGVPVIASNVDGMADVVSNGADGLLFEAGNDDACKKALYQFFSMNKEERTEMGEKLKNTINTKYTLEDEINAYKNLML